MKITLKSIKYSAFASEETVCYQATLLIDGKKIGTVKNDGRGGPDYFWGDNHAWQIANEWCKANLPVDKIERSDGSTFEMFTDIELLCGVELTLFLRSKDLKRALRSKVLLCETKGDEIYEYKWRNCRKIDARHIAAIRKNHPTAIILNELPFNEALAIYAK